MEHSTPSTCLHCLSAFCFPATGEGVVAKLLAGPVSIAFRLSASRLLHAFDVLRRGGEGLHCLSAFCFPATLRSRFNACYVIPTSPLPFGFLLPGYNNPAEENINDNT